MMNQCPRCLKQYRTIFGDAEMQEIVHTCTPTKEWLELESQLAAEIEAREEERNNLIAELDRANYTTMVAVERAEAAEARIKASQEQEPVGKFQLSGGVYEQVTNNEEYIKEMQLDMS